MYRIAKCNFRFEAAHRLPQLPKDHPCRNLHGHSWVVDVLIYGNLSEETGFVIDFGHLKFIKEFIDKNLDHSVLVSKGDTELLELCKKIGTKYFYFDMEILSAETLARFFAEQVVAPTLSSKKNITAIEVSIWETINNQATYTLSLEG